jgi:hypothetical protein
VARGEKLLDNMRRNPRDWSIADIAVLCDSFGIDCTPPKKGSHFKVKHARMPVILTIPANRPIKPVYIRALVRFVDSVRGDAA